MTRYVIRGRDQVGAAIGRVGGGARYIGVRYKTNIFFSIPKVL